MVARFGLNMIRKLSFAALLMSASTAFAQTADDDVVMTVNGTPVTRSEFVYSYNKNNGDGVIDRKTVEEYADLYANYKLKVAAAVDARLDTLASFRNEYNDLSRKLLSEEVSREKPITIDAAEGRLVFRN